MDPIGCLVFPDVEELDLVGPWELFGMWHDRADGPRCVLLAADDAPVRARHGLRLVPEAVLADAPPLSALLVPGGDGTKPLVPTSPLVSFVEQRAPSVHAVLSVCTGARVLEAAGLLQGRRATTHWAALDEARSWPGVEVVEQRVVRDGPIWTAAGVSAGIGLALAYIDAVAGDAVAVDVQRHAEYVPAPTDADAADWPGAPAYVREV